jgi:uncharacterized protein
MLGKLAKWLRILGFDTRYEPLKDQEQIDSYRTQGFFLITRKEKLCGQARVFCLGNGNPIEQLREVVTLASITQQDVRLLQRCVICNEQLREVTRDEVFGIVPDYVFGTLTSFHRCPQCLKVYWPGSHPERMMHRLEQELGWAAWNWTSKGLISGTVEDQG